MKKESSSDKIIIFFASLTAIASLTLMLLDVNVFFPIEQKELDLQEMGEVAVIENKAQVKHPGQPMWKDLSEGDDIFFGDQVFVSTDSRLIIKLLDGGEIILASNSLVALKFQGDQLDIDVKDGEIVASMGADSKNKINISTQFGTVALTQGATTQIINKDGNQSIRSLKGDVRLLSNDKKWEVLENQMAKIVKDEVVVEEIPLSLENPEEGTEYFSNKKKFGVKLLWKVSKKARRHIRKVQVSKTRNFEKLIINKEIRKDELNVSLPPGLYYWKVGLKEKKKEDLYFEVAEQDFSILDNREAVLDFPKDDERVKWFKKDEAQKTASYIFKWKFPSADKTKFKIEIFEDKLMKTLFKKYTVQGASFQVDNLSPKTYHWRIMPLTKKPKWGKLNTFTVVEIEATDSRTREVDKKVIINSNNIQDFKLE